MSLQMNVHEAKTHFSKILAKIENGEEIIISKAGTPVAKVVPIKKKVFHRKSGTAKGKIKIGKRFFDPLPDDIMEFFQ